MAAPAVSVPGREFLPIRLLRLASDQRLVEHVRGGSERAFEVLFDRHHRSLLAFCSHMLGSREEAEDVVQQTFLAAYRDLVRSEAPIVLRPWLYGIARHRCLSALRRRRERTVEPDVESASVYHLAADVAAREDVREMLVDIGRLPDEQRIALVLTELGDLSHEEIALVLGCRREQVKALVFQARTALAAARDARATPCPEIREQLVTLRGPALRRANLRRHLNDCAGCREFNDAVRAGRRGLRSWLPLAPAIALKRAVLGALPGPGGAAGGAAITGGGLSIGGLSVGGLAATALVAVAIPAAGVVGAVAVASSAGGGEAEAVRTAAIDASAENSRGTRTPGPTGGPAPGARGDTDALPETGWRTWDATERGGQPLSHTTTAVGEHANPEGTADSARAEPVHGPAPRDATDPRRPAEPEPQSAGGGNEPDKQHAPGKPTHAGGLNVPAGPGGPPQADRGRRPATPPQAGPERRPAMPPQASDRPRPASPQPPVKPAAPKGHEPAPPRPAPEPPKPAPEPPKPAPATTQPTQNHAPATPPQPAAAQGGTLQGSAAPSGKAGKPDPDN